LRKEGSHGIAAAEFLKVEVVECRRGPQPERVDGLAAVTYHGTVEGDADQARGPTDHGAQLSCAELQIADELDFDRFIVTRSFPRVWATESVVRQFALPAVLGRLFEDAALIAQTITHGRYLHRGRRV